MPENGIRMSEATIYPAPFLTQNCGERAVAELDRLIALLKTGEAVFVTARSLAQQYAGAI